MVSYVAGAASEFNGEDLIRQSNRGIVVVLIQYRLGIFGKPAFSNLVRIEYANQTAGFLAGSAVKKNGALNAGLRKALEFVLIQRN